MNFSDITNIVIPEGEVFSIHAGGTLLWNKPSPGPSIILPPDNQIWYEATSQISSNLGNPVSHTFDSETGKGVLTYSGNIISSYDIYTNAFKSNPSLQKIWWPDCCQTWYADCMHTCVNLKEVYAGSALQNISDGTCNGGTTIDYVYLVNNTYFYDNPTGLVKKSDNILYLGTYNLDIRDTPCTTLGNRCMADTNLDGATLYFPSTMTSMAGDWNIGSSTPYTYTIYLPCSQAPNWNLGYIRGIITWHIPAINSGYEAWKIYMPARWTFIEDL